MTISDFFFLTNFTGQKVTGQQNGQNMTDSHCKDSCVIVISETWLDSIIHDVPIELASCSIYHTDRTDNSGLEQKWMTVHIP